MSVNKVSNKEVELLWVENYNIIKSWTLNLGKLYKVGRSLEQNQIVIYDSTISKCHAIILVEEENAISIMDMKSTNGTQINNNKIVPNHYYYIKEDDKIFLGDCNGTNREKKNYLTLKIRTPEEGPSVNKERKLSPIQSRSRVSSSEKNRLILNQSGINSKKKTSKNKLKPQITIEDVYSVIQSKRNKATPSEKNLINI